MEIGKIERKANYLIDRFILSHFHLWITNHIEKGDGDTPQVAYDLKTAGYNSRAIHAFDDSEIDIIIKMGSEPEFDVIRKKEISLLVMALEVARLWVLSRPRESRIIGVNISDKRMAKGRNEYTMYLVKMKNKNHDVYIEQKEIIESTSEHAKIWLDYIDAYIRKEIENQGD